MSKVFDLKFQTLFVLKPGRSKPERSHPTWKFCGSQVHNWAQAVSSAEASGASAVVVFNDLDAQAAWMVGWMVSCGCFFVTVFR